MTVAGSTRAGCDLASLGTEPPNQPNSSQNLEFGAVAFSLEVSRGKCTNAE